MSNRKRNILIYLDSYPMVTALPPDQRGWLLTALLVYGDRLSQDQTVRLEDILEQFPKLGPEGRAVCGFMAGSILRDTQKWLNRQHSRQQVRGKPSPAPAGTGGREDLERTRRLLEKLQGEA